MTSFIFFKMVFKLVTDFKTFFKMCAAEKLIFWINGLVDQILASNDDVR